VSIPVIFSGGTGTRSWPVSREARNEPKDRQRTANTRQKIAEWASPFRDLMIE
jgi:mannose-1-phosphate guanylyltransferase